MYNSARDISVFLVQSVFERYKTEEIIDIIVYTFPSIFKSSSDKYKSREMCHKVFPEDLFMLKYCPDRYKTQKICDIAIGACLLALKVVPDWFVMNKMLETLDKVMFSNNDIHFDYTDPDIVTFFSDDMGINTININVINFDDNDDDLETMINIKPVAWCNKYKQRKAFKKELNKELMIGA